MLPSFATLSLTDLTERLLNTGCKTCKRVNPPDEHGDPMPWDSEDEDGGALPPKSAGNADGNGRQLPSGWGAVRKVARGMSKPTAERTTFNWQLQRYVNDFEKEVKDFDPEKEENIAHGLNALRDFYYLLGGVFMSNGELLMDTNRLTVKTARDNPQIGVVARKIMDSAYAARKKVLPFMFHENRMRTSERMRLANLWVNMERCIPELKKKHEKPTDEATTAFDNVRKTVLAMRAERAAAKVAKQKAEDDTDSDATELDE